MKTIDLKKMCIFITTGALILTSCSKDETKLDPPKLTSQEVKSIVLTNDFEEDINRVLDKDSKVFSVGARMATNSNTTSTSCFLRNTLDINNSNKSVTLNFGSGCTTFGKKFAGKMIINYALIEQGYNRTVSFQGFSIDGNKIEGKAFVENSFGGSNKNPYSKFVGDFKITLSSGKVISRKGTWKREQVKGASTVLNLLDDEYATTGSWESVSLDGFSQSITIETPLKRKSIFVCSGIVTSGVIKMTRAGQKYKLDFGDGTCDEKLKITHPDGKVEEITFI